MPSFSITGPHGSVWCPWQVSIADLAAEQCRLSGVAFVRRLLTTVDASSATRTTATGCVCISVRKLSAVRDCRAPRPARSRYTRHPIRTDVVIISITAQRGCGQPGLAALADAGAWFAMSIVLHDITLFHLCGASWTRKYYHHSGALPDRILPAEATGPHNPIHPPSASAALRTHPRRRLSGASPNVTAANKQAARCSFA